MSRKSVEAKNFATPAETGNRAGVGRTLSIDSLTRTAEFPEALDRPIDPTSLEETASQRFLRRGLDIGVACLALACFALILPIIAVAIKVDSRGPVFYSQTRVGMNRRRRRRNSRGGRDRRQVLQPGRPFRIYKLRSMCENAEASGPQWAAEGDMRVTGVGRFLRKTRLDEVPQFWNVLKGEMSLIGPRPERLCFIRQLEQRIPFYQDRLLVQPGITGLAQIINGYDESEDSVRRKVYLDRKYIREKGPRTNFKVLLHTVRVVLTGSGAR